jgi:hypothetical protein
VNRTVDTVWFVNTQNISSRRVINCTRVQNKSNFNKNTCVIADLVSVAIISKEIII